jgi:hypothetical protein
VLAARNRRPTPPGRPLPFRGLTRVAFGTFAHVLLTPATSTPMPPATPSKYNGDATGGNVASAQLAAESQRFRLADFRPVRTPSGLFRAEVELEWHDGTRIIGRGTGQSSAFGDLRIAAEATLDALRQGGTEPGRFEMVGVKDVRAFDAHVVIVSVIASFDGGPTGVRLVGAAFAEDADASRGAVLAVLNATNRIIARRSLPS